ncbi:cell division protein FtsA [bacterium]|nr:MAG: cell division protein FtsA [bacterium]
MSKPVVALDLGGTRAVCLAADMGGKEGFQVTAYADSPGKGFRRGVLNDLEEASRMADAALRRLETDLGHSVESVLIAVSGGTVEGVTNRGMKMIVPKGRTVTHQDVLEVINHSRSLVLPPDREQFQAVPRTFRVDTQSDIERPVGMTASRLEVDTFIVSAQTSILQNLERSITRSGRRVEQMVLGSLAAGIGVLSDEDIQLGAAVVDIGGGTTDIAIFIEGSVVQTASVPVGGDLVTSDLSKLLKTSPDEAERLKIQHAQAWAAGVEETETVDVLQLGHTIARPMQRRVLCEIVEARMRELAVMARQQIERSGWLGMLPGGLVLTGGSAQAGGIHRLFEEIIPNTRVRVAQPNLGPTFGEVPGAAVALGIARYALQCDEELATAEESHPWRDRVRTLLRRR